MTIRKALKTAADKLKKRRIPFASLDAEVLLSHVLKKPRSYLYIWPERKFTRKQETRYKKLIKQRLKHEPVAYLINNKEFYGLNFYVNKNVLIPRPETECLIDKILKIKKPYAIADIGTGSGCIAITLKKYLPKAKIYASDVSKKALVVAKKNAKKHKTKILFKEGDLLEPWKKFKLDVIVANLPYLKPKLMKHPNLKFEPTIALDAGKKGLDLYERFFNQMNKYHPKTKAIIEIESGQVKAIQKIIKKNLPKAKVSIIKDLAGRDRVAIIK